MNENSMICPECNKVISLDAKICSNCGYPIKKESTTPESDNSMLCPECNKTIPKKSEKCPHCGYPIAYSDESIKCPECGNDVGSTDVKCAKCGFPIKQDPVSKLLGKSDSKKRVLGIALLAVGIIFAFLSYKTRFMGDYDYYTSVIYKYEDNIRDYGSSKREMLDEANSYKSDFFKSSYQDLASGYQRLIDDAEDSITEYKGKRTTIVVKAVLMLVLALLLAGAGAVLIKKNYGGTT